MSGCRTWMESFSVIGTSDPVHVSERNSPANQVFECCIEPSLENLVHNRLALLVANEASSISKEGTNHARSEAGEESLHAALLEQSLRAIHESLVLAVGLDDAVDLKLGLRITTPPLRHLHNIDGIDASPVGETAHASSHELSEHALILHIAERLQMRRRAIGHLSVLQHHAAIPLVHSEVQGNGNHITEKRGAEALIAAEDTVDTDDLLDGSADSRELRLVFGITLRANDLHLQLGLEQIHGSLDKSDGHTGESAGGERLGKGEDLSVADDLLHLAVGQELDSIENHVA